MKKITLILIAMAITAAAFAQTGSDYDAAINQFQTFYNQRQADSIFNMLSDKLKALMPVETTAKMLGTMQEQFGEMKSHEFSKQKDGFNFYKVVFGTQTLSLVILLNKDNKLETFRFLPYKPDSATPDAEKSNFVLKTPTGNIYGTLTVPDGDRKTPIVLIIAGSGAVDRDGNAGGPLHTNTYLMLADSLQKAGIASVRYDKRSVGESAGALKNEESLSFDDMINDAAGFVKMLKEDSRFSRVIILGHSEGSLIGMIAAAREKTSAFISVAGICESADKVIVKQIGGKSKELADKAAIILDSLKKGYTVTDIDPLLNSLFSPAIQPYMRSWLKYDPFKEIKKLKEPVLIVQGTTDIQVGVEEAEKLKKAYPNATLKIIAGMNHILKQAPADRQQNIATYSNPDLPLCPEFAETVVQFINSGKVGK